MASKQIQEIKIRLLTEGLEGLDKLKSSFRGLQKAVGPTEEVIQKARRAIHEFGDASDNTEQVIKGQIEALKGLQSQAKRGSETWVQLTKDIEYFRGISRRTDAEISVLRDGILSIATGSNQSQQSLRSYIADLGRLRNEATITGSVFSALGNDISELTARLEQAETQTTQTGRAFGRVLGQALASTSAGARKQIQDLKLLIDEQQEFIDSIDSLASRERRLKDNVEARAAAQERLNRALAQQRQLTFQESARAGRQTVRSAAAAFADPAFLRTISPEALDKRLGELPNTTAGLNQGLSELSERLANTTRNTTDYLVVAMQMAGMQRELTAVTQGYAQALLMGIRTGTVAPSARNLQEVITALRAEMSQLDVTTSEGARAYAENASQARALEQQLKGLANAYRHVGDMAMEAATAQTSEATARVTANYLNRSLIRQQEQAMAELAQRVRAGVAATPLALPAAGQTTAPGTGLQISGGARVGRATGRIQQFFAPGTFLQERLQGPVLPPDFADRARRAAISEAEAVRTAAEARQQAERQIQSYRAEIDKARRADIGSIDSTQRLREAINQYRSTLPGASAEFRKLTKELESLDARSEKLSRGLGRRRMSGMQLTQAAGAAISGGIFGGPEGFAGGVIGTAFGGVGGAFAGAAIGAQISGIRQQAGAVGEYVAQLNLAKTTLAQAASNQDEYNRLLQLARSVSSDYAVALQPSIEGLAQIATAAQANNLTFKETEAIYRGVIASGVAFGKSQQDLDALIRATTQVLSKGKVSAEEMSGQIGERLPGAVAKFAAATGRTLPELAKAFERGEVTIADFVKFASDQFEEYDDVAQLIAEGPEKAGVRLQIALDTAAENFGGFFQRTGSSLQEFLTNMINWVNQNSDQIKVYVTDWINAGAAIVNVLSQIGGAFARTAQRAYEFYQSSPQGRLGNFLRNRISGMFGSGQGPLTPEQVFPEFIPPQFGGGGAVALTGGGIAEDSSKAKAAADKAAREEERIRQRLLALAIETQGARQLALIKGKIAEAEIAGNRELAIRLKGEERNQQILIQLQKSLADVTDERLRQALLVKSQVDLESAGMETAIEMERQRLAVIKEQNEELFKRAGFTPQDEMGRGAGAFDLSLPDLRVGPAESQMNEYRKQLEDLSDPVKMAVEGADAIGNAFGQAFQSLVTGAKSAQQALSDAFKAIGEAFIQMAAEIIAKQLAMIAFQALLRAFGGGGGGFSFGGQGPVQLPSGGGFAQGFSIPGLLTNAKGNVYAQNGIQPFANGGIVTKPTFFKYADGGTFSNGVMGEAGPEAIMPLKRGADGKLGVAARLTGAMQRYRPTPGSAAAAAEGGATAGGGAAGATMEPIDVRYSVERINNVDYVTADQFQAGMRQAAQQGAQQGERRALATLRQNTAQRKRIGI